MKTTPFYFFFYYYFAQKRRGEKRILYFIVRRCLGPSEMWRKKGFSHCSQQTRARVTSWLHLVCLAQCRVGKTRVCVIRDSARPKHGKHAHKEQPASRAASSRFTFRAATRLMHVFLSAWVCSNLPCVATLLMRPLHSKAGCDNANLTLVLPDYTQPYFISPRQKKKI